MTEQELRQIATRANAASPSPWAQDPEYHQSLDWGGDVVVLHAGDGEFLAEMGYPDVGQRRRNIAFILAARDDVPALIQEVRRLRAALETVRDHVYLLARPELQELAQAALDGQSL